VALERNQWQAPVDAGAISARGKRAAAEDKARQVSLERNSTSSQHAGAQRRASVQTCGNCMEPDPMFAGCNCAAAWQILEQLKLRGCTEEFVPNPSLLDEGRVSALQNTSHNRHTSVTVHV
jgi:hypothetical protein